MTLSILNVDATLTNAAASLLTSSVGNPITFTRVTITNFDGSAHNVTLYRVPAGGAAANGNIIVSPSTYPGAIPAGETVFLPLTGHSLIAGQSLYGKADTGAVVNISISYVQQS